MKTPRAKTVSDILTRKITQRLSSAERLTGLPICLHDRMGVLLLSMAQRMHFHPACRKHKQTTPELCYHYDRIQTHHELAHYPEGRIQTCPHGFTEIAVPVMENGILRGVLFAGPCLKAGGSRDGKNTPHRIPGRQWLEDRWFMIQALASQISLLLEDRNSSGGRQATILDFMEQNLSRPVKLTEISELLNLSPSRTGHLIQEIFGMSFPALQRKQKLNYAARLLVYGDLPVGHIAQQVGFDDQSYFSRVFTQQYGKSPLAFRTR